MIKTHFEKIKEFNKAFGITTNLYPNHEIFNDVKLVDYRMSLINEEIEELKEAVRNKDFIEVIDALADIEYVILGFYTALGINGDKAFDIVHNSNMSKLCKTLDEAEKTVEYYKNNNDKYDSPTYRLSDDKKNYIVYNKNTRKILKSIEYNPADFTKIIEKKNIKSLFDDLL